MKTLLNACAVSLLALTQFAWAAPSEAVRTIQNQWAEAMYHTTGDTKEAELEKLANQSRNLVAIHAQDADAYVWEGIILASYAGAKGGLGALSLVKEAKSALEKAIELNPDAMNGSAYTSLGSLYYQVPGWPLGFGDDEQAEKLLKKGLSINPTGIDPNYFYGDFLYRQKRYDEAQKVLETALKAAPREGRALADEGRRGEINKLLEEVKHHKS